jgi:hypothetical protein
MSSCQRRAGRRVRQIRRPARSHASRPGRVRPAGKRAGRRWSSKLLADADLMKQMLVADGANARREGRGDGPAQYGQAMTIYTEIQKGEQESRRPVSCSGWRLPSVWNTRCRSSRETPRPRPTPLNRRPGETLPALRKGFPGRRTGPGLRSPEHLGSPHGRRWGRAGRDARLGPRDAPELPARPHLQPTTAGAT